MKLGIGSPADPKTEKLVTFSGHHLRKDIIHCS